MDNNQFLSLVNFLKYFINRPNHLARYLIDNEALNKDFIRNISKSPRFNDDANGESKLMVYFVDINQMNNFFKNLNPKFDNNNSDGLDLYTELNIELQNCLREERYEDAVRIRDYLKKISNKEI
jgi:hypothetical protein